MSKTLLEEVVSALPEMFTEWGFRISRHVPCVSFDNELVELRSPDLRLRFVRDRGYVGVEVASVAYPAREPRGPWDAPDESLSVAGSASALENEWVDIVFVIRAASGVAEPRSETVEDGVALLRANRGLLVQLFSGASLHATHEMLAKLWAVKEQEFRRHEAEMHAKYRAEHARQDSARGFIGTAMQWLRSLNPFARRDS
jgi:hypothetical protein